MTIKLAGRDAFSVRTADVRRADTSAAAIDEWTGERVSAPNVPEGIKPAGISPVGNYAVQVVDIQTLFRSHGRTASTRSHPLRSAEPSSPNTQNTPPTHTNTHSNAPQITWEDGFNQVAPFEVLGALESQKVEDARVEATVGGLQATAEISG